MLRVVLDTNVILSGTIRSKGNAFSIIEAWRGRRFLLITSDALVEEVRRVLTYAKFHAYDITPHKSRQLIQSLRRYGISTEGKLQVSAIPEDPQDNQVLAAAVEERAEYIVTGDKHLQILRRYGPTLIVSPAEFVGILERKTGG